MMSVAALTFSTYEIGERRRYSSRCSHGLPMNSYSVRPCASELPYQLSQGVLEREVAVPRNPYPGGPSARELPSQLSQVVIEGEVPAATNRSVRAVSQLVMKPP